MSNSAFTVSGTTGISSITGAGLITGGTITSSGTLTVTASTQSDQENLTSSTTAVTPSVFQFHPAAAKFWLEASSAGGVVVGYNITSVVNNGTGDLTINITNAFQTVNYAILGCALKDATTTRNVYVTIYDGVQTSSSFRALCAVDASTQITPNAWYFCGFGDQP